jgi:hypothetical protein
MPEVVGLLAVAVSVVCFMLTSCSGTVEAGTAADSATASGVEPAGSGPGDSGDNGKAELGPSEESAAGFAVEVVTPLLSAAFYAEDGSFVDDVVAPDRVDVVAGVLDGLVSELRWAIATAPGATERSWFVAAPLTVKLDEVDRAAGTAVVEVWAVTVFSRQGLAGPESRFVVETVELVWDTGRWWLVDLSVDPGPAAGLALSETPATPVELDEALTGHGLVSDGVAP